MIFFEILTFFTRNQNFWSCFNWNGHLREIGSCKLEGSEINWRFTWFGFGILEDLKNRTTKYMMYLLVPNCSRNSTICEIGVPMQWLIKTSVHPAEVFVWGQENLPQLACLGKEKVTWPLKLEAWRLRYEHSRTLITLVIGVLKRWPLSKALAFPVSVKKYDKYFLTDTGKARVFLWHWESRIAPLDDGNAAKLPRLSTFDSASRDPLMQFLSDFLRVVFFLSRLRCQTSCASWNSTFPRHLMLQINSRKQVCVIWSFKVLFWA